MEGTCSTGLLHSEQTVLYIARYTVSQASHRYKREWLSSATSAESLSASSICSTGCFLGGFAERYLSVKLSRVVLNALNMGGIVFQKITAGQLVSDVLECRQYWPHFVEVWTLPYDAIFLSLLDKASFGEFR